ncbi:hypothetical protein KJ966_18810 [bacterium]|nr:hypothetical protein [bacterium]
MTQSPQSQSRKWLKTALLAAATVGIYAALFANEATVTKFYTKGSFYAALPVLTAFAFSIIHGAFAGQCLEMLGITASKSTIASTTIKKQKQPVVKKDQRARLTVN